MTHWTIAILDVDGTLIDLAGAGSRSMGMAFEQEFGIREALKGTSFAGRTDRAIVRAVLERAACTGEDGKVADADVQRLYDAYLAILPGQIEKTPYTPTPGARRLVAALTQAPTVRVGVATGNLEPSTKLKLRSAGIEVELDFGAYGGEVDDRAALVQSAIDRATSSLPAGDPWTTWVLGDTPHDVAAAKKLGARSMAVAQGPYTTEDLRATGADRVVADLTEALEGRFWLEG